jgi:hypothetical protein
MSDDVNADFARLHGIAQLGASGFDMTKGHPLFTATHSMILAHKYGREDVQTYMRHPGLRSMDTRQAALESLQSAGSTVKRFADMYRPSIPGPIPDMSGPATTVPTSPGAYKFSQRTYSKPMTPPGSPL